MQCCFAESFTSDHIAAGTIMVCCSVWVFLGPDSWMACRGVCEARALRFGRRLLLEPFDTVQHVVQEAEKQRHDGKKPCHDLS